ILFSPDQFRAPVELQTRWLVTKHRTLDEEAIAAVTAPELRRRLEATAGSAEAGPDGAAAPAADDPLGGPAVGRAEVAVLAVTSEGAGTVGSCEIVVQRGGSGRVTALGGQSKVSKE